MCRLKEQERQLTAEDEEKRRVQMENQRLQEELARLRAAEEERARQSQAQGDASREMQQPEMLSTFGLASLSLSLLFCTLSCGGNVVFKHCCTVYNELQTLLLLQWQCL